MRRGRTWGSRIGVGGCAAFLMVLSPLGCASAPEPESNDSVDEDLTAGAKLLSDPDKSPERTLWWPEQQQHDRGEHGSFGGARGDSWETQKRESAGVLARTPIRILSPGKFIFLLQLDHDAPNNAHLGKLVVRNDRGDALATTDVVAKKSEDEDDEWQRATVAFELQTEAKVSLTFEWNGAFPMKTGLASLTRPERPFYNMGHNPNSIEMVNAAVKGGANAIEPDIQFEKGSLVVRETGNWATNWFTGGNVKSSIDEYFSAVAKNPKVLLVTLDLKPQDEISYEDFGKKVYAAITKYLPPEKVIFSIDNPSMTDMFKALPKSSPGTGMGRDISSIKGIPTGSTDPLLWSKTAETHKLTFLSMGISPIVPISLGRWFGPLSGSVKNRDRGGSVKKTYYWTINKPAAMRQLLDMNLDALITDDNQALTNILQSEPYKSMYRPATATDSQFVAHGVPYGP